MRCVGIKNNNSIKFFDERNPIVDFTILVHVINQNIIKR